VPLAPTAARQPGGGLGAPVLLLELELELLPLPLPLLDEPPSPSPSLQAKLPNEHAKTKRLASGCVGRGTNDFGVMVLQGYVIAPRTATVARGAALSGTGLALS
jgi:hypothetical protein